MPLTDAFPGAPLTADSTDLRKDLAGLIVRNVDGSPRPGLFFRSTGALGVARATDMRVDINLFHAALARGGGVLFINNDGVSQSPVLTVPSANQIIHVIYVKQNESATPYSDTDNLPKFGFASSDQSATPSLTQAKGRVPDGGLPILAVQVPSTASTTSSQNVIISEICDYTTTAGGSVPFRNSTDLLAWTTAADNQRAHVINGPSYERVAGAWKRSAPVLQHVEFLMTRAGIGDAGDNGGIINAYNNVTDMAKTTDTTFVTLPATSNVFTFAEDGECDIHVYAQVGAAPTGQFLVQLLAPAGTGNPNDVQARNYSPSGTNVLSVALVNYRVTAGTTLRIEVQKTTSGNADVRLRATITKKGR